MSIPDDIADVMRRPIQEGDMLLFIGVSECVLDVHGLKCVPESEYSLDGLAFFELHLSKDGFPEAGMSLRAFEKEFNCTVRFLNRAGHTFHHAQHIEPGDILCVEGEYALLHLHFDQRFTNAKVPRRVPRSGQFSAFPSRKSRLPRSARNTPRLRWCVCFTRISLWWYLCLWWPSLQLMCLTCMWPPRLECLCSSSLVRLLLLRLRSHADFT